MIRYGVIGTGMMGVEHISTIGQLDNAVVTAIADPYPSSLAAGARAVGPNKSVQQFDDYRNLLASGICDAVVIATPNFTHADVLADVLTTGHHVMVEKPLCTTVADCQRMIQLELTSRPVDVHRCVWMGLEYRYMAPTQALLGQVRTGILGDVQMVSIREHRFPFLSKVGDWNRFSANTGGTLVEKACHFFDLMNQIVGEQPQRVMASGGQNVNHLDEWYNGVRSDILDSAYVVVEYNGGVRGMLDLCMFAEASKNEQELCVVGSSGKCEALVTESVLRTGLRRDGIGSYMDQPIARPATNHTGMHHGATYHEHVEFAAAIRNGQTAGVTLEDGLWAVAVGEAAHRSISLRRAVDMSEVVK